MSPDFDETRAEIHKQNVKQVVLVLSERAGLLIVDALGYYQTNKSDTLGERIEITRAIMQEIESQVSGPDKGNVKVIDPGDPWRSDEEAQALIEAINPPEESAAKKVGRRMAKAAKEAVDNA